MRRFLIVQHTSHFIGNVTTTTATVTGPEGLRALSADEAVGAGLMPTEANIHWQDLGGVGRRILYVNGSDEKLLLVDPHAEHYDTTCDPTAATYAHACPDDDYRYTWYEAPEGGEVKITCHETWHEMGRHKQAFEFEAVVGEDGVPQRPLYKWHVGTPVPGVDNRYPLDMTDDWWNEFITTVYHTEWYAPISDEERAFNEEMRSKKA